MPGPQSGNTCLRTVSVTASSPVVLTRVWLTFLGDAEEEIIEGGLLTSPLQIPGSSFMGSRILFYCCCIPATLKD